MRDSSSQVLTNEPYAVCAAILAIMLLQARAKGCVVSEPRYRCRYEEKVARSDSRTAVLAAGLPGHAMDEEMQLASKIQSCVSSDLVAQSILQQ